jgi:glutaredoxin 3
MAEIIIYTKPTCPYCIKAKGILTQKNQTFTEINIANDDNLRTEMIQKANGRHTVPQIFINNEHIGGCDDLVACDNAGDLDKKLGL